MKLTRYSRGPVEEQAPVAPLSNQAEPFLPFDYFQIARSFVFKASMEAQLLLFMRWKRIEPLLIPIQ